MSSYFNNLLNCSPVRFFAKLTKPKIHPTTGLPLSKSRGQHILHNEGVLNQIIEASQLQNNQQQGSHGSSDSGDTVFEVGPGTGVLTMKLLACAKKVIAMDIDNTMLREVKNRAEGLRLLNYKQQESDSETGSALKQRPSQDDPFGLKQDGITNLELISGDVLTTPLPQQFDICVANLPYQISSKFLFKLLHHLSEAKKSKSSDNQNLSLKIKPWKRAVLMFQTEFVNRLVADPGEKSFNRLSMNARLYVKAEKVVEVKAGSFIPLPQVHSTVVRLTPRFSGSYQQGQGSSDILSENNIDFVEWDAMIRMLFLRRRRTINGTIRVRCIQRQLEKHYLDWCTLQKQLPRLSYFKQETRNLVGEVGPYAAYTLDIEPLVEMLKRFNSHGIFFSPYSIYRSAGIEVPLEKLAYNNDNNLYGIDQDHDDIDDDDDSDDPEDCRTDAATSNPFSFGALRNTESNRNYWETNGYLRCRR